ACRAGVSTKAGEIQSMGMIKWIKAGTVLGALACALAPFSPAFVERWYSTGLSPRIQPVLTPLTNLIPFALFDVLTIGAVVLVIVSLVRAVRRARQTRRFSILLGTLGSVAVGTAAVYLIFLVLWGFNYRRVSISQRLVVNGSAPSAEAV